MESNPRTILALIRGCKTQPISEYLAGNLEMVAKMLSNDCTLDPKFTLTNIEKKCFVSTPTAKMYVAIFHNAYLFVTEQGDREKQVTLARKGNRSYFGIACLLDQKIVDRSRYESVKSYAIERIKKEKVEAPKVVIVTPKVALAAPAPKPAELAKPIVPPKPTKTAYQYEEEITQLKKDVKLEHERVRELNKQLQITLKDLSRLTELNEFLKRNLSGLGEGRQLAEQLSRFFAALGTNLMAEKQVECLELATRVRDLVAKKFELRLPTHTIWQGKKWARISFTDDAKAEFLKFSRDFSELPRALKHALFNLSLNFRHPSLRTYKKEVNPAGIPADAFTSRASNKFRFYWTTRSTLEGSTRDVELLIHKIDVKRG